MNDGLKASKLRYDAVLLIHSDQNAVSANTKVITKGQVITKGLFYVDTAGKACMIVDLSPSSGY